MRTKEQRLAYVQTVIDGFIQTGGTLKEEYKGLRILTRDSPRLTLMIFRGDKTKPVANFYFHTSETREEYIAKAKAEVDKRAAVILKRKAAIAEITNEDVPIGTIYVSSWGYEQTNIDFFQVVGHKGRTQIVLSPIHGVRTVTGMDQGRKVPTKDSFKGKEIVKKLGREKAIHLNDYSYCCIWDGTPQYCSWGY